MKQKIEKPISEFTSKQRKTYKIAMKALAGSPKTRRQLYSIIRKEGIYKTKRDRKEALKMLINNPNTHISLRSDGRAVNEIVAGKDES